MRTLFYLLISSRIFQYTLPKLLSILYRGLNVLKNTTEQEIFFSELKLKLHLVAVVAAAKVNSKDTFTKAIQDGMSKNTDYPPFILEGITFKYFSLHLHESLHDKLMNLSAEYHCRTRISMMHVGMGMALGLHYLKAYKQATEKKQKDECVLSFFNECVSKSKKGYAGCAIESLGLLIQTHMRDEGILFKWVNVLINSDLPPEIVLQYIAWIYHGLGRGYYFAPKNLLPTYASHFKYMPLLSLKHLINKIRRSELTEEYASCAIHNAVAGVFWAISAVSLTNPSILLDYLRFVREDISFFSGYHNSIIEGIQSNFAMLSITMPYRIKNMLPTIENDLLLYIPSSQQDKLIWEQFVKKPRTGYLKKMNDFDLSINVENIFCVQGFEQFP